MIRRWSAICVLTVALAGWGPSPLLPPQHADAAHTQHSRSARVFQRAQRVIRWEHVRLPWDGRYQVRRHPHHLTFCVETFNGSRRAVRQYGRKVPPGFYLLFCSSGHYYVNDGTPFRHTRVFFGGAR